MNQIWSKLILTGLVLSLLLALTACGAPRSGAAATGGEETTAAAPGQTGAPAAEAGRTPTDAATEAGESRTEASTAAQAAPEPPAEPAPTGKDTLVVYFSATGTTKAVGEKIAAIADADLYEIKAAREYTEADLNWHDSDSRTTAEQNDSSARPEIGSEAVSLAGYTTVYNGYPIWWGEEPRILDTFVEAYDFDGITLIPFCTSSSSGLGRSGQNLAENAGSGTWLEGKRFGAGASEEELRDWIDNLNEP